MMAMHRKSALSILALGLLSCLGAWASEVVLEIHPSASDPRNSEGAFIALRDGRLLFIYSHFTGSTSDDAGAHLAGRYSKDGGKTWDSDDTQVLENEGQRNTMSVSLLRLNDGRIALFYLRKNSDADCRAYVRFSDDEAATWSDATCLMPELGYFVVNNDRVIQLASGRLVVPAARHCLPGENFQYRAQALFYLSDDNGVSWRVSPSVLDAPPASTTGLQEPGAVEVDKDNLLALFRTDQGVQLQSRSLDGGETWSVPETSTLRSPISPASFKMIPGTDTLMLVWNDHRGMPDNGPSRVRTPLSIATSTDGGRSWSDSKAIEDDPAGWYCYTAIEFTEGHCLLAYCCAKEKEVSEKISLRMRRIPIEALTAN